MVTSTVILSLLNTVIGYTVTSPDTYGIHIRYTCGMHAGYVSLGLRGMDLVCHVSVAEDLHTIPYGGPSLRRTI
jgi:hypothetical protein